MAGTLQGGEREAAVLDCLRAMRETRGGHGLYWEGVNRIFSANRRLPFGSGEEQ